MLTLFIVSVFAIFFVTREYVKLRSVKNKLKKYK